MSRWKGRLVVLIASWGMCVLMLRTEVLLEFALSLSRTLFVCGVAVLRWIQGTE